MDVFVARLFKTLCDRRQSDPSISYVASLCQKGPDAILKKIGEEATEVVLAGKAGDDAALIREVADLYFHSLVLLASRDISPERVIDELTRREGVSGLAEKAARTEKRPN